GHRLARTNRLIARNKRRYRKGVVRQNNFGSLRRTAASVGYRPPKRNALAGRYSAHRRRIRMGIGKGRPVGGSHKAPLTGTDRRNIRSKRESTVIALCLVYPGDCIGRSRVVADQYFIKGRRTNTVGNCPAKNRFVACSKRHRG